MKKFFVLLVVLCIAPFAVAQTTLDDFESGVTDWQINGNGAEAVNWDNTDGANSTSACMEMYDDGWSYAAWKNFTAVVPSAGNYKVTFFYKNGHADNPLTNFTVYLNGANFVELGSSAVTTWTASETGSASLSAGGDVEVRATAGNSAGIYRGKLDEIELVEVASVPISQTVFPLDTAVVAGTTTIETFPSGGSGTFTQAEFDIENDGTIESTDSTPGDGFTYDWDTDESLFDGLVDVKVIVTDDNSDTGEAVASYTIDNTTGRTGNLLANGGFEAWTGGVPDSWTIVKIDGTGAADPDGSNATVSEATTEVYDGASALKINFAASGYTYRYTILSDPITPDRYEYQVSGVFRGSSARVAYFESEDGVTWATTGHLLDPSASPSAYKAAIDAPWDAGLPAYLALATHQFLAEDCYWDKLSITATTVSNVQDWDLY